MCIMSQHISVIINCVYKTHVRSEKVMLDPGFVKCWVPQGSILDPLFLFFMCR